jgi:predicted N-formylglutamate amidohydrolase
MTRGLEAPPLAPLLGPEDPPPFRVLAGDPESHFFITCDHAGRRLPRALGSLGLGEAELETHIAWDIGAAGVAEKLSAALGAFTILQTYSRLAIDCNRPLGVDSSIAELSESTVIPGNRCVSEQDAQQRAASIFHPYHHRIRQELDDRQRRGVGTVLLALHSFTPTFLGESRPWQLGVLYGRDARLAHALLAVLRADGRWVVGDNEPYRVSDLTDYGVVEHGERRGLLHVELEIRQDLIRDETGQSLWAERLAPALRIASGQSAR